MKISEIQDIANLNGIPALQDGFASLYLTIINNLQDGVYFVDLDRRIMFWNKAAERITGYTKEEIIGKKCNESGLDHIDSEGHPLCIVGCPVFSSICSGEARHENVFVRHKNGYRVPVCANVFPVKDGDKVVGAIEIFTRNSPRVYEDNLVEQLSEIAMRCPLTHLPNRRYLESFLNYKFDEWKRFSSSFAVLFADIDDFRLFNNNFGHELGDRVLKTISKTLRNSVRRNDLVGRWGGEEFVSIYAVDKTTNIAVLAEKFRQLVKHTEIYHEGKKLFVSMSVGITLVQKDDTPTSIIDRADKLMYQAKKLGKNCAIAG